MGNMGKLFLKYGSKITHIETSEKSWLKLVFVYRIE